MAAVGGCRRGVLPRMYRGLIKASGALKSVQNNRGLWSNALKCLYKGGFVQTALYETEAWSMINAERRKVNVLEMKCLRSCVSVTNG